MSRIPRSVASLLLFSWVAVTNAFVLRDNHPFDDNIVIRGPFGGDGGSPTEFYCPPKTFVARIQVQHHDRYTKNSVVSGLRFFCSDGKTSGSVGTFIDRVAVHEIVHEYGDGFDRVSIASSSRVDGFGVGFRFYGTGTPNEISAPKHRLIGFRARSEDLVEQISFVFQLWDIQKGPFGRSGGTEREFQCPGGEFVQDIYVQYNAKWGEETLINYLSFKCTDGSWESLGRELLALDKHRLTTLKDGFSKLRVAVSKQFNIVSGIGSGSKYYGSNSAFNNLTEVNVPGYRLTGFKGRFGDYVDQVAFNFAYN